LRGAVVVEEEIFGAEAEDDAVASGDEDGDHDEVGADGEFDGRGGLRGSGLLGLSDAGGGEREEQR
jgi:hypothetical protein